MHIFYLAQSMVSKQILRLNPRLQIHLSEWVLGVFRGPQGLLAMYHIDS